jgi:UDP-N-acetylglucosamine--dolichyl-phosphate N-acetylglucosaminephosphotransferase
VSTILRRDEGEIGVFPKVPDYHKPNRPLVSNGLGVFYVLFSTVYLFLVYFSNIVPVRNEVSAPLTLAVCILFGGFMGLLDDWIDLRWRYKAFLPLIAAIPLIFLAKSLELRATVAIPFTGVTLVLGDAYFFIIIPLLVTVVTNTVNQLGGLNGLETVCPAIVLGGLMLLSGQNAVLLYGPLAVWLVLAALNLSGRIFVGNSGSFAIGITLASFAIISDLKFVLAVSILPYIVNSVLILLTFFFFRVKANVKFDGQKLSSDHRRSLITLITYNRPLGERQVVAIISILIAVSTAVPVLLHFLAA